jgi:PKD repeat protein
MNTRLPVLLLLALAAAPVLAPSALAQERGEDTWYLRPRVGLSYYLGDNDKALNIQKGDLFNEVPLPWNLAFEVGKRVSPTREFGLALTSSGFGNINDFAKDDGYNAREDDDAWALQFMMRNYLGTGKRALFWQAGVALQYTDTDQYDATAANFIGSPKTGIAFGPHVGFGIDFRLNDRTSLALESGFAYMFPDAASDGRASDDGDGGFGPGDLLGWNTLGLSFDMKKFIPVMVTDLICPANTVDTGAPTTFSGSYNEDASGIVGATWDFGDGSTARGLTASHAFNSEGTYNVVFAVSNGNGKGMDSRSCTVTVEDPCEAARITSMTASNMSPDTRSNVRFSANISGTQPATYSWNFGDGSSSTSANPSHTYSDAGTYTVTLEVTNCGGTVSRTMSITVVPYEAAICREIEEMNSAFFARNSSTLTAEARGLLQENLDILQQCPNLNARVEGWAAPGERRPQQLSEDRARAAEQFYVDNGIAASRLVTAGMGRAQGLTSKKEGLAQFQRVDTIPVRH